MTIRLEFTLLGTGSSGGVPRADGAFGACDPNEPRNHRTRCGLAVRRLSEAGASPADLTTLVVDTPPEFRLQAVRAGLQRLDGVLFSHDHADQTHGIDDIRAFFLRQRLKIPCYADAASCASLGDRFSYVFRGGGQYPPIAELLPAPEFGRLSEVAGPSGPIPFLTYDQDHGDVRALGFRLGDVAYSADVVDLPQSALDLLQGLDVFIIDALRYTPHPTHAHLDKALAWISMLQPRRAILTNMHIDLDYQTLRANLPAGVEPGYDGMRFVSEIAAII